MTPTNEELFEAVKILGNHVLEMEKFLLTIAQTQATQFKLMNSRITDLTSDEQEILKDAASKCETSLERQEFLANQFRNAFHNFLKP